MVMTFKRRYDAVTISGVLIARRTCPWAPSETPPLSADTMIGICGGVGPAAGILLHQTILQHTDSQGVDQGHLNVCHFSRSADITPRMEFLLEHKSASSATALENPACGMARTFEMMKTTAQAANVPLLIKVDESGKCDGETNVKCLHLLQETARFLAEISPSCKNVGVMCTNGTRDARVFNDLLEPLGYNVLVVDEDVQVELQDTISNPEWGIKSNAPIIQQRCIDNFHKYARQLIASGAEVLILGCTEIPFAFGGASVFEGVVLLDPLVALSRALIREVDPSRLKPLVLNGRRHP